MWWGLVLSGIFIHVVSPCVVLYPLNQLQLGVSQSFRGASAGRRRGFSPRPYGAPPAGFPAGVGRPGRRAPARGVDVKPPPGPEFRDPKKAVLGPWGPFPPQTETPKGSPPRRKSPKPRKMAIIPHFGVFLAIFGISGLFRDPAGVAFTSTPRGGALRPEKRGFRGAPRRGYFPAPRDGVGFWARQGP